MVRTLPVFALCAVAGFAQTISLGALAGGRVTDDMTGGGATGQSKSYVVGPAVGFDLPLGFGVEVDALYRREGYQSSFGNFDGNVFSVERANSWEFPILGQYRLPIRRLKTFVEIGYAPRVIRGTTSSIGQTLFPQPLPPQSGTLKTDWPVSQGVVVGGGVRFGIGPMRIAPTVRYTHWSNAAVSGYYGDGAAWALSRDQVDIMIGIAWTSLHPH
jgi:hypothetical protein